MGIVNVTPDSFSDGGLAATTLAAVDHARRLIDEGADIIDIGGESTRPGSEAVSLDSERRRVLPVLERLATTGVALSVDTSKPELMRDAIACGADMINDVAALRADGAVSTCAESQVAVCLMHMQGEPRTMQVEPSYADVVGEVGGFLAERVRIAQAAGIGPDRIVVDPGFGFGKTLEHNLELLRGLERISSLSGVPVLAGVSRKSMLGRITGHPVDRRLHASVSAALLAVLKGARIVRVHDVGPTRDALAVYGAVMDGR